MNDRPSDPTADIRPTDEHVADTLLARALRRAWWTILWERLWPALASVAVAVGIFLAVSWAGLWLWLPPLGRAVALFAGQPGLDPAMRHEIADEPAGRFELLAGPGELRIDELLAQQVSLGPVAGVAGEAQPLQAALEIGIHGDVGVRKGG